MMIGPDDPRLTPVALRRQLIAAGESDASLARAVRSGALARPRRGAYTDGGVWRSMTDEQRYAVRSRACFYQADTKVLLSHVSALPFLDAPLWGLDLGLVWAGGRWPRAFAWAVGKAKPWLVGGASVIAAGPFVAE